MKNTLKKEDKDFLEQIRKITGKILKIYMQLFLLDLKDEKNTKEYLTLLTHLNICLELEGDLYKELDLKKIEEYLLFINIHDLFSFLSDYDVVIHSFDDLLCLKRIYNQLENIYSSSLIKKYQATENSARIEHKLFVMDAIDLDMKNLFLFLMDAFMTQLEKDKNKIEFKRRKYLLLFLNPDQKGKDNIFNKEEKIYLTSKSLSDLLGIKEETYNELLFIYYKKYIASFVKLAGNIKDEMLDDYETLVEGTLYRLLIESIFILNEGNAKIKEEIHDIIKETEGTITTSFLNDLLNKDLKREKIILLRSERLELNGSSK